MSTNPHHYTYNSISRSRSLEDNFKEINENVGILLVRLPLALPGHLGILHR